MEELLRKGVGTIPTECNGDKDAGLCYDKCAEGYYGVGPVCWRYCPSGWTDNGIGCTKPAPYGRGGGYPWKFGDGFNEECLLDVDETTVVVKNTV